MKIKEDERERYSKLNGENMYAYAVFYGINFDGMDFKLTNEISFHKLNQIGLTVLFYNIDTTFLSDDSETDLSQKIRFNYFEKIMLLMRLLDERDFNYCLGGFGICESIESFKHDVSRIIPHKCNIVVQDYLLLDSKFSQKFFNLWENYNKIYDDYKDPLGFFQHSILDSDADYSKVFIFIALETILLRHDDISISRKFNNRINGFYENLGKSKPLDETIMKDIYGSLRSPKIHSSIRQDTITNDTINYQQLFRDVMILIIENSIELPKIYSSDNPSQDQFLRKIYNETSDELQKELLELKNPKIRIAEVFIDKSIRKESIKLLKSKNIIWGEYVSSIIEDALNKVINDNEIY